MLDRIRNTENGLLVSSLLIVGVDFILRSDWLGVVYLTIPVFYFLRMFVRSKGLAVAEKVPLLSGTEIEPEQNLISLSTKRHINASSAGERKKVLVRK